MISTTYKTAAIRSSDFAILTLMNSPITGSEKTNAAISDVKVSAILTPNKETVNNS